MAHTITDKCVGCAVCTKICPTGAISGERSKQHRIAPLRCIDCRACGRVCPHGAVLDEGGHFCERIRFKKRWERPAIDRGKCIACNLCIDACPTGCLAVTHTPDTDDKSAWPVLARPRACIACSICVAECPVAAVTMVRPED